MLLFYVRHGDPIYNPDSLTPLGKRQAEAVGKRLSLFGVDEIYSSTSQRAIDTATPTAEMMKKEITQLDFANEGHAWREITAKDDEGNTKWLFSIKKFVDLFNTPEVQALGYEWYEHPEFKACNLKPGLDRIKNAASEFIESLGYRQIGNLGKYEIVNRNNKRVALFAHAGFGLTFLSFVLGIPYPLFATHFDLSHSSMTVIEFQEIDGYAYPKVLTHSSDSHLYKEGLPTRYNNRIAF